MNPNLVRAGLFLSGFVLWAAFSIVPAADGHLVIREGWDRAPYWQIGVPLLLVVQAVLTTISNERLWRLPLWTLAGHFAAMLVIRVPGSDFGLLPLALVFIGVPAYGALFLASLIGRKLSARSA